MSDQTEKSMGTWLKIASIVLGVILAVSVPYMGWSTMQLTTLAKNQAVGNVRLENQGKQIEELKTAVASGSSDRYPASQARADLTEVRARLNQIEVRAAAIERWQNKYDLWLSRAVERGAE